MQTIPQRATDAKFIASIEGFKGNLFKLGRLLRHDWFSVKETGHKARDRYLFLFKARILITKVKRISDERSVFILKDIIRLPETSLCDLTRSRILEFRHIEPQNHRNYPILLEARNPESRDAWLSGVKEYVVDTASVDDLLFDDEIRVVSQEEEDRGIASPLPDAEEFEELPEDYPEQNQVVPQEVALEPVEPPPPPPPPPAPPAPKTAQTPAPPESFDQEPPIGRIKRVNSSELLEQIARIKEKNKEKRQEKEEEEQIEVKESHSDDELEKFWEELEGSIKKDELAEHFLEDELWENKEKSPVEEVPNTTDSPKPKETEVKEETPEDFDFWSKRETSPPLREAPQKRQKLESSVEFDTEFNTTTSKTTTTSTIFEETSIVTTVTKESFQEDTTETKQELIFEFEKPEEEVHIDVREEVQIPILKESKKETDKGSKVETVVSSTKEGLKEQSAEDFDFWAPKETSPLEETKAYTSFVVEKQIEEKKTSFELPKEEFKLDKQESGVCVEITVTGTVELNLPKEEKESTVETSEESKQTIQEISKVSEEEVDFWATATDTAEPSLSKETQKESIVQTSEEIKQPTKEISKVETEEVDFWATATDTAKPSLSKEEKQESIVEESIESKHTIKEVSKVETEGKVDLGTELETVDNKASQQYDSITKKQPIRESEKHLPEEKTESKVEDQIDFWTEVDASENKVSEEKIEGVAEKKQKEDTLVKDTIKGEFPSETQTQVDFWSETQITEELTQKVAPESEKTDQLSQFDTAEEKVSETEFKKETVVEQIKSVKEDSSVEVSKTLSEESKPELQVEVDFWSETKTTDKSKSKKTPESKPASSETSDTEKKEKFIEETCRKDKKVTSTELKPITDKPSEEPKTTSEEQADLWAELEASKKKASKQEQKSEQVVDLVKEVKEEEEYKTQSKVDSVIEIKTSTDLTKKEQEKEKKLKEQTRLLKKSKEKLATKVVDDTKEVSKSESQSEVDFWGDLGKSDEAPKESTSESSKQESSVVKEEPPKTETSIEAPRLKLKEEPPKEEPKTETQPELDFWCELEKTEDKVSKKPIEKQESKEESIVESSKEVKDKLSKKSILKASVEVEEDPKGQPELIKSESSKENSKDEVNENNKKVEETSSKKLKLDSSTETTEKKKLKTETTTKVESELDFWAEKTSKKSPVENCTPAPYQPKEEVEETQKKLEPETAKDKLSTDTTQLKQDTSESITGIKNKKEEESSKKKKKSIEVSEKDNKRRKLEDKVEEPLKPIEQSVKGQKEDKEEEFDFWAGRESSPPIKRSSIVQQIEQDVEVVSKEAVSESTKNLEQVEKVDTKLTEVVAEQEKLVKPKDKAESKQTSEISKVQQESKKKEAKSVAETKEDLKGKKEPKTEAHQPEKTEEKSKPVEESDKPEKSKLLEKTKEKEQKESKEKNKESPKEKESVKEVAKTKKEEKPKPEDSKEKEPESPKDKRKESISAKKENEKVAEPLKRDNKNQEEVTKSELPGEKESEKKAKSEKDVKEDKVQASKKESVEKTKEKEAADQKKTNELEASKPTETPKVEDKSAESQKKQTKSSAETKKSKDLEEAKKLSEEKKTTPEEPKKKEEKEPPIEKKQDLPKEPEKKKSISEKPSTETKKSKDLEQAKKLSEEKKTTPEEPKKKEEKEPLVEKKQDLPKEPEKSISEKPVEKKKDKIKPEKTKEEKNKPEEPLTESKKSKKATTLIEEESSSKPPTMDQDSSEQGVKPIFTKTITGDVVESGDGTVFVCEVEHPGSYYVTWLRDNKPLDDKLADRVKQIDDGRTHTLKMLHCRTEDSGIYTAKATDPKGACATCSAQLLVQEFTKEERAARIAEKKPFFLVTMKDTEVIENTYLSYAIHVQGTPMPNVTFIKDNAPLQEDDRVVLRSDFEHGKYEILIHSVNKEDAGTYKCKAKNKFGTSECQAQMSVAEEEEILMKLSGKGSLLAPGESAEFKWFRDGVEFDPVERFNVMFKDEEDTLALVFQNVTPDDAGIYTCVASTSCGKISCSAELTVEGAINRLMRNPEKPSFVAPLEDSYTVMGGTGMLECKVGGFPKPDLVWSHQGKEITLGSRFKQLWEDEESVTLCVKNIDEADKGKYSVVATNELGEASCECTLIIKAGPKFRKLEKIVGCHVGKPLDCVVEADGEPMPTVQWLKNGEEMFESNRIKFASTSDGKFTLKIDKVTPQDCGAYSIVATNDMGQRTEQFRIDAETPPEITRGLDAETERKWQTDHTFEVRAKGSPPPTAKWYHNGVEIQDSDHFKISKDEAFYMLKICNITNGDKGTYKIVLTNNSGSASSEGNFKVRGPPRFKSPLKDACAKEGAKGIKMSASWESNPRPNVVWYFNDKAIHEDTPGVSVTTTDDSTELIIAEANADVVGTYSIKASNEYGDESCKARFRLHEHPQVLEPLKDVEFLENKQCTYSCKVSGVPVPEVTWTKDGSNFSPDGERVKIKKDGEEVYLVYIEDAQTDDSGHYSVTFKNVEGSVSTEGSVIVNTPPHILGSNFKEGLTFIAMHKFVLEVEAKAVPQAEATWLCNGKELSEEEDSVKFSFDGKFYRMERIGSDPEQSGEYICRLKNKITEVDEVGQILIIEKESRVRKPLQPVFVKEYDDGVMECQIVGDPYPTVQWYRDGVEVSNSEKIEICEDEKGYRKLIFKDVREAEKSTFKCVGKNEHGNCETTVLMTVHVVPQPGELQDITVDWGKELVLSVFVHAIPYPGMTWYQDGKELEEGDRIEYLRDETKEIYSLSVKSVGLEDAGKYTYTATNVAGSADGRSIVKIHTEVPTIIDGLKDIDVCLEDEVTFKIKTAGLPIPEVEWRNKNSRVNEADRYSTTNPREGEHTITLKDLVMGDYGEIQAISSNLVGKASTACKLTQKFMPCEILEELKTVTKGAEGKDVTLKALIRASPRPMFVWTKDGDVIEQSPKHKLKFEKTNYRDAKISVTIYETSCIDAGQYRLRIQNEVNEASTETSLVIVPERMSPSITSKPQDFSVSENESGSFRCKIAGFPKPDVKWLKDGREVRPTDLVNSGMTADGIYYLDFKNISKDDAGKYTVVASNDEGKMEVDAYLAVDPADAHPEFLQTLEATKVTEGYPCRMEVKLAGHPKPKVTWKRNGRPVQVDGDHYQEYQLDDGTVILQISSATPEDEAEYSVEATNVLGNTSSSADLSVLGHIREDGQPDGTSCFTEGLKDCSFDEGKTMRLPVAVKGGPVPDMKWYKDGKEIKLDSRTFFTYDGDKSYLEIRPCKASDSGVYKCVIENEFGPDETQCNVNIRKCFEAPTFYQMFPGMQQVPGKDVKLSIKVDGVPRPEISWYCNNNPITPDGEKYKLRKDPDGCTLYVRDCVYGDTGTYKCVAKNKEGETSHQAHVQICDDADSSQKTEAPVFLKVIGDQELYENFSAKFKAVVSGKPTPDFEWFKDGHPVYLNKRVRAEMDEEGVIRLTIKHVCRQDSGLYELRVWNEYGEARCKGRLFCECISSEKKRPVGDEYKGFDKIRQSGAPIPLSEPPLISSLSDRRVTLSWPPYIPVGPQPPVTYQVEMCECPEGDWVTAHTGIRGCSVDLTTLIPKSDYRFRVRVENKFGVSEPSPYASTYRTRLEKETVNHEPMLDMPEFPETFDGPYVPPGFELRQDKRGRFYAPPRFLRLDHDTQYGTKNFNARTKWVVYGYPTPKLKFYFKDEEIEFTRSQKYTTKHELTGEVYLFVNKIIESDVGWYKCVAHNEYGESQQRIRLCLCEYPRVIEHIKETHMRAHTSGKIFCRISAYPPCDVTWYKNWHEIKPHMNLKPTFIEPDIYCLNFHTPQPKDTGLYSISAVNVAGAVSSTGMVHIEEDDMSFSWTGPGRGRIIAINSREGCCEDHYDIGDEIGRGTQGIVYYITEHHTGRNFAAKAMWGTGRFRDYMHHEFEMMNLINSSKHIVRLYDAYEGQKNLVLVEELCAGGDLLSSLTMREYITESEVALYMRQILEGLDYMHDRSIAHCGLNIGDIFLTHPNSRDIKFGDLSLARHIRMAKLLPLEYGMPEFVAPEIADGGEVSFPVDMWAVGIITYILLSGTSPFRGAHDRETLTRVRKGELCFDMDAFSHISSDAKDFMAKLLIYKSQHRMTVKEALKHRWLSCADYVPRDPYKIHTDRLRSYYFKFKDWYRNASCRHWYRRRTLESCFTHPSKMVYPPYEVYTPPPTPERELRPPVPVEDYEIPHRQFGYEVEDFKNESNYQCGPDTYLLQHRDPDFPSRLRRYMKYASKKDSPFSPSKRDHTYTYDDIPIVHERRRFTDIMDEELTDEKKRTVFDRHTVGFVRSSETSCSLDMPRRLKQELSSRYVREEVSCFRKGEEVFGKPPFIREKPETTAISHGMPITLSCFATGNPEPIIQWFRNDVIIGDTPRCTITCEEGRSIFTINECREFDAGQYKVVARSSAGQAVHRFRLVVASPPGVCDPPEADQVSGTQILLRWRPPIDDGGSTTECYHLQMRPKGDQSWVTLSDNIEPEIYLVEGLKLNGLYHFRLAAKNARGWGEFSISSSDVRTTASREDKVCMPIEQELITKHPKLHVLQLPGARGEIRDLLDYSREVQHVPLKTGEPADLQIKKYKMVSEISRGQFSVVMRCLRQDDQRTFACKILKRKNREAEVSNEYEIMKSLRHERLVTLYEAYQLDNFTVFTMENLSGLSIVSFLANKIEYNEQMVAVIVNQIIDAVSYLTWRGLCHLAIQPDNVIITSPRRVNVKLVDFGHTQKVDAEGSNVLSHGHVDFMAPEVVEGTAFPNSDIWSVGAVAYLLLTGTTPFTGIDENDTKDNIQFVRYKYEELGNKASQEATRFIMLIFKKDPSKRPLVDECKDHRWLVESDYMTRKRERAAITPVRIREYESGCTKMKFRTAAKSSDFLPFTS